MPKPKVLFLCLGNSCRSIMAEALTRHQCGDRWEAASAGLHPLGLVTPETLAVLAEVGVSPAGLRSKGLNEVDLSEFYLLVHLAEHSLAGRIPPEYTERVIRRPVPDPYGGTLGDYRRSRDAIQQLISRLCRRRGADF